MVPWLKPTSARRSGGNSQPRQLGIEKRIERAGGGFDAALHLAGIEARDREPLIARRAGNGFGRIGRDEDRRRQLALPVRRQADEIVAVGAVAVTQHDQMRRRSALRRQARTGQGTTEGHACF
ncbi:MAG: hypothetical protein WDM81_16755 [Rhizomicrobium sp.]